MSKKLSLRNAILSLLIAYKYIINAMRIWLAIFLFFYQGKISSIALYLENIDFIEESHTLLKLILKLYQFKSTAIILFAITIFALSLSEIIFVTGIARKRRWGILGLIVTSFLWLPLEIIVILKFFTFTKFSIFAINLLIIIFLINLVNKRRKLRR